MADISSGLISVYCTYRSFTAHILLKIYLILWFNYPVIKKKITILLLLLHADTFVFIIIQTYYVLCTLTRYKLRLGQNITSVEQK